MEDSTSYEGAPFDDVWEAVIETMAELNYPISNMEKASGLIATDRMLFPAGSSYLDCGEPGVSTIGDRWGRFNVFVRLGSPVRLSVNTSFQTSVCFAGECRAAQCASTGLLERDIQEMVRVKLDD